MKHLSILLLVLVYLKSSVFSQGLSTSYIGVNSGVHMLSNLERINDLKEVKTKCEAKWKSILDYNFYSICVYSCQLKLEQEINEINFETDISHYVEPISYSFHFFNSDTFDNLFNIVAYQTFSHKINVACGDNSSNAVLYIKRVKDYFKEKQWDFKKVVFFDIDIDDDAIKSFFQYNGESYVILNDHIVSAKTYLQKKYTIEEYKKTFSLLIR